MKTWRSAVPAAAPVIKEEVDASNSKFRISEIVEADQSLLMLQRVTDSDRLAVGSLREVRWFNPAASS